MADVPIVVSKYGRLTPWFDETIRRWRDQRTGRFTTRGVTMDQIWTGSLDELIGRISLVAQVEDRQS